MPRLAGLYLFTSDEPLGRLKAQDIRQFKERFLTGAGINAALSSRMFTTGSWHTEQELAIPTYYQST